MVQADDEVGGGLFCPVVFDVGYGLADDVASSVKGGVCVAGDVEHAGETAGGSHDGHGLTGHEAVLVEEVLAADDLHEFTLGDGGPDGVGTGDGLGPGGAGHEGDGAGTAEEGAVALRVEDDAGGVSQKKDTAYIAEGRFEEAHLAQGEAAKLLILFLKLLKRDIGERFLMDVPAWAEPVLTASLPGCMDELLKRPPRL